MESILEFIRQYAAFQMTPIPLFAAAVLAASAFFLGSCVSAVEYSGSERQLTERVRKRMIDLAYDEAFFHYLSVGEMAYDAGDTREDNPYCPGYLPNDAWDCGWCAAAYQAANPR